MLPLKRVKYILKSFECIGNFVFSFYVVGLTFVVACSLKLLGFKFVGGYGIHIFSSLIISNKNILKNILEI